MSKSICSISVKEQLDSLRELKDGWYDGNQGVKLSDEGLDWLIDSWNRYSIAGVGIPFLNPWIDGSIHGEYSFGEHEIGLDFDLNARTCSFLVVDLSSNPADDTNEEYDFNFRLNEHFEWSKFFEKVRQCQNLHDV